MITKTCPISGQTFSITDEDLQFYEKMGVPTPTLHPTERMRRRLCFRNFSALYHRECQGTGKKVISMYHPDGGYEIYDNQYWWSDHWDAATHGRDFDFSRPFFEQFKELNKAVPKMARVQQGENPNSRYTNCASYNKDSYLLFTANNNESCMYGTDIDKCRDCYDTYGIRDSELIYEGIDCVGCYEITHSQRLKHCTNCHYCFDCIGCQNCFGCIGLRKAEYYILNKKVDQKEFEALKKSPEKQKALLQKLRDLFIGFPHKYADFYKCEESIGDHMSFCKKAEVCFDCHNLEDCKFCQCFRVAKSCYDISYYGCTQSNELCYECEGIGHGVFNLRFSKLCWGGCQNLDYCFECFKCEDCFGCSGLQNKKFHIFNKPYEEKEYHGLREKIIEHMKQTQEFGEFFPINLSPFAYNESAAFDYLPLNKAEVQSAEYLWREEELHSKYEGVPYTIPENIDEVSDDVLNEILQCQETERSYRIMGPELAFYRKMNLPLPKLCPKERHRRRLLMRNPWNLHHRTCHQCQKEIQTTYAPDRPEKILCEECYLNFIN